MHIQLDLYRRTSSNAANEYVCEISIDRRTKTSDLCDIIRNVYGNRPYRNLDHNGTLESSGIQNGDALLFNLQTSTRVRYTRVELFQI
jgi:hypothetical protein